MTIFVSSACLLILEIVAARLLAPYVGVSLYTWTAIIGVILAGLSLGNWLGGRWADRGAGEFGAGLALAASAATSVGVLLLLTWVAPLVQQREMGLLGASFVLVAALFLLPAIALGVIAPLLTTLALRLDQRTGRVVGALHALAALGSITGTFLAGYWLIQYFGTRNVVSATAGVLLALALPYLRARPAAGASALVLVLGVGLLTWARGGFANPCLHESNYFCIRVVDSSAEAPYGEARSLVLDHLLHGTNHRQDARLLLAPYVHLMDELIAGAVGERDLPAPAVFFAGGGAFTQPRALLARYPGARVTVAEIDPLVTATARRELFLDTGAMQVQHRDARVALAAHADASFDVVVTDVFRDLAIPYHLVTSEYAALVHAKLRGGGLYTLNAVDVFPPARFTKSLVKTLQARFRYVDVFLPGVPRRPQRVTFVITASDAYRPAPVIQARAGIPRRWLRVTEPLLATGVAMDALPVLRDDYVPVERLIGTLLLGAAGR